MALIQQEKTIRETYELNCFRHGNSFAERCRAYRKFVIQDDIKAFAIGGATS